MPQFGERQGIRAVVDNDSEEASLVGRQRHLDRSKMESGNFEILRRSHLRRAQRAQLLTNLLA